MSRVLLMPEVAANTSSATLATWSVEPGETFESGACLAEIETDKATIDLPADEAGVMGEQLVAAGQEVEVGTPICVLRSVGEEPADSRSLLGVNGSASEPLRPASEAQPPDVSVVHQEVTSVETTVISSTVAGRVFSSPLARRYASELGVNIAVLSGRGPNGRIVRRDIDAALDALNASPAGRAAPTKSTLASSSDTAVPHSRMRQAIARRLSESKATVPHFYVTGDVQVDRLLELRRAINEGRAETISINDFIVHAAARTLELVPDANASWTEESMIRHPHADVAVAVSTDTGLITPIVRAAETMTLSALSAELSDLISRARSGRLHPSEFEGGSLTVSNLGMFGVQAFSAIINPPQAAILAVGAARKAPVVRDEALAIGTLIDLTLSVDHRAIDGALAAQWFATFVRLLENPSELV